MQTIILTVRSVRVHGLFFLFPLFAWVVAGPDVKSRTTVFIGNHPERGTSALYAFLTKGLDDANSFLDIDSGADQVQVGDEILSRSSFRRKNIKPTELREVEREENNEEVDELEQVGDEGDDSGEGDGDEDAVNLVDKEEHVRNVEEIESEDAIPGGILIEEADSLEQPGQFHSSLSDSTS